MRFKGERDRMDLAGRVIKLVERLRDDYEQLLEILQLQQSGLIQNQVDLLDQCTSRLSKQLQRIEATEAERVQVTERFALMNHLAPNQIDITMLEPYMDASDYTRLLAVRTELQTILQGIGMVNEQNQSLLAQAVQYTHQLVQTVATVVSQGSYGSSKVRHGGGIMNLQA